MMVKVGDILAVGLIFLSAYILTDITNYVIELGKWFGVIGGSIVIVAELNYLKDQWLK